MRQRKVVAIMGYLWRLSGVSVLQIDAKTRSHMLDGSIFGNKATAPELEKALSVSCRVV
jgi:hypothetical protein